MQFPINQQSGTPGLSGITAPLAAPCRMNPAVRAHDGVCGKGAFIGALLICAALGGGLLLAASGVAAELSGSATLRGTPPPEIVVDLTDFPDVSRAYPHLVGKLATRHYLVSAGGGLANVFVYVKEGLAGRTFPAPTSAALLDQTNAGFYPYVIGVQVGQELLVRNSEPYLDGPQCETKTNKMFNFAQPITGMVSRHRFEHPEVLISTKCGIHPWEFAFIGVVPHPFFAVTGSDGRFALPAGLPPGKYVLEAVHPKAGRMTREVEMTAEAKLSVDFVFDVPAPRK